MEDWFLLYLLTRVDAVKGFAVVLSFLLGCSGAIALICYFDSFEDFPEEAARLLQYAKRIAWLFLVAVVIAIFTPSRNDVIFIAGGSAILEASRSGRAQAIGSKTLDVIESYLDDAVKKAPQ